MVVQGKGEYVGEEVKEDWPCFDIIETGDGYLEGFFCMCLEFSIMKVNGKKHKTLAKFHWHGPEGTNLFPLSLDLSSWVWLMERAGGRCGHESG